jgi:lipoprotein-anchoring transpeptidase ErfK/SrfK
MSGRVLSCTAMMFAAVALSSPAKADGRSFFALFEGAAPAQEEQAVTYEDPKLAREYAKTTREIVSDPTQQRPGTVTIDTANRVLYLSLPDGRAVRYGVGVGREGFTWHGHTRVGKMAEWPDWTPPAAMLKRRPDLPRHMGGGEENPLGARAMYLFSGARDTGFRIHGSNEPWTIGQAVSSGCIRMLNEDVMDLYRRVKVGTTVRVL